MSQHVTGIFGDKGQGEGQKNASQAKGSQGEAGNTQHQSTVPATPLSPSQVSHTSKLPKSTISVGAQYTCVQLSQELGLVPSWPPWLPSLKDVSLVITEELVLAGWYRCDDKPEQLPKGCRCTSGARPH